jgi:hypothetical protein
MLLILMLQMPLTRSLTHSQHTVKYKISSVVFTASASAITFAPSSPKELQCCIFRDLYVNRRAPTPTPTPTRTTINSPAYIPPRTTVKSTCYCKEPEQSLRWIQRSTEHYPMVASNHQPLGNALAIRFSHHTVKCTFETEVLWCRASQIVQRLSRSI